MVNVNYSIFVRLGNANGTGPPSEEFTAMASEEASKKEGREGGRERKRERKRERESYIYILFFQHLSVQMF